MKTNCIVCNAEVGNWDGVYPENESRVYPIGGTVFRTYEHRGSTVFYPMDTSTVFYPMDTSYLEIVICDTCLASRMNRTYGGSDD